jgi:hypothetical protein
MVQIHSPRPLFRSGYAALFSLKLGPFWRSPTSAAKLRWSNVPANKTVSLQRIDQGHRVADQDLCSPAEPNQAIPQAAVTRCGRWRWRPGNHRDRKGGGGG